MLRATSTLQLLAQDLGAKDHTYLRQFNGPVRSQLADARLRTRRHRCNRHRNPRRCAALGHEHAGHEEVSYITVLFALAKLGPQPFMLSKGTSLWRQDRAARPASRYEALASAGTTHQPLCTPVGGCI